MSYSIIRMQKMKSSALKGLQFHNQRERESDTNPDIDAEKSHLNYDLINDEKIDYKQKIDGMIQEGLKTNKAVRKDAVKLAEFLITSDNAFFDDLPSDEQKRFFKTAFEFLAERYGEQNLAYATVHNDEKTPHMHVGFVPLTEDGRLSAKDFFGKKLQLVKLQDDYNQWMKENGFDLERGVSSSRKHLQTGKFKALTNQQLEREAQQNYEKLVERIKEIDTSKKEIEEIKHKKLPLGHVGIKSDDYTFLVERAQQSALHQAEAKFLEEEVERQKAEIKRLEAEVQAGQDRVRKSYKEIALENMELRENMNEIAEKKSEKLLEKKGQEFLEQYKDVVNKYNNLARLAKEKVEENDKLKTDINKLEKENRGLNDQVSKLQKGYMDLVEEFTKYKERVAKALNNQLDRVKSWLNFRRIDKDIINELESKREGYVAEGLRKIERPDRPKEQGLER